ncbi:MAG: ATP-binding protein [Pseudomonadota bacterium]
MNLAFRLNLMVALALLLLLGGAVSLILTQARESVAEETDSALTLTLQLLEALSGAGADLSAESQAAALPSDNAVVSALIARVSRLRDVRHVDIGLVRNDGMQPFVPAGMGIEGSAPRWFARLVEPEPVEYRYQLALQGRRVGIALRPRPGDEVDEAWKESRATFALLVSFAFLVMLLTGWMSHRALRPVDKVLRALDRLEQGDYSTRVQRFDLPELQRISDRLNHVATTLSEQAEENQELSRQALAIQEAERRHLAQELHDELGQAISAIKALAVSTRQRAGDATAVTERTSTICDVSDQMYSVVRRLMSELRPAALDDLGLRASIEKLVEDWSDRHHGAMTQLTINGELADLHEDVTIKIYRIVQEALTNVARHAGATRVDVHIAIDENELTVLVGDDGVGITPATLRKGLGLVGMRERIESLGGTLTLDRQHDDGGTIVYARIPHGESLTHEAEPASRRSPLMQTVTPA